MKTSNKILIGLLSTIFFVMMAFFLDIRVFGERRSWDNKPITKDIPVGEFAHINVDKFKTLKIVRSDKNYFQTTIYSKHTNIKFDFSLENDTLNIFENSYTTPDSVKLPRFNYSITLFTNCNIQSITSSKSQIRISGLEQDSIRMSVSNGVINSFGRNGNESSHFKKAKIAEYNSRINFRDIKVDTLEIQLENSNAEFRKDIYKVLAKIKSKSTLSLKDVEKLKLEKDENSRIYIRYFQ